MIDGIETATENWGRPNRSATLSLDVLTAENWSWTNLLLHQCVLLLIDLDHLILDIELQSVTDSLDSIQPGAIAKDPISYSRYSGWETYFADMRTRVHWSCPSIHIIKADLVDLFFLDECR